MMPEKNIEWSKVPGSAIVIDEGRYYRVRFANGQEAVAFWGSRDAREAQTALRKHAMMSKRMLKTIRSWGK